MEKLEKKYHSLLKAQKSLKRAIDLFQEPHPEKYHLSLADSMIQRFEYNTDLFWKFIKLYLQEHEKMIIEAHSPRAIIRESAQAKIILPEEQEALLKAIESRNLSSHLYNEDVAEEIATYIPEVYIVFQQILGRIKL